MRSGMTFETWFNDYVFGFMLRDVSRELAAAERGDDAANFLCALGLLTYTESLGAHVPGTSRGSRNRFEAFFRRLGPAYEEFLQEHPRTYDIVRNGLIHEHRFKKPATIVMLDRHQQAPCGLLYESVEELITRAEAEFAASDRDRFWLELAREIAPAPDEGRYYLVVQRYFRDFVVAADELHRELVGRRHSLIHVYAPDLLPASSPHESAGR